MSKNFNERQTWTDLGLGMNIKLKNETTLWIDIEKVFGKDLHKKWNLNIGVKYTF